MAPLVRRLEALGLDELELLRHVGPEPFRLLEVGMVVRIRPQDPPDVLSRERTNHLEHGPLAVIRQIVRRPVSTDVFPEARPLVTIQVIILLDVIKTMML